MTAHIPAYEQQPAAPMPRSLRVARVLDRTRVLGPGTRTVVWVQGCPLRCSGCLAPEALPLHGGTLLPVDTLADRIARLVPAIDGVTFSGGEPFAQAPGLVALSDELHARCADISLMSFTGFTRRWIGARGSEAQRELLARLDVLVDGPYVVKRHAALRWRGSSNQRLHLLSDRHDLDELGPDVSAGLELEIRPDSSIGFVGVPPAPGFRDALTGSLLDAGLELT